MKQKIWIFNHYAVTPKIGPLTRHYNFATYLIKCGYDTTVFAANQIHFSEQTIDLEGALYKEIDDEGVPFIFIKSTEYRGNGKRRVLNMISYTYNLFRVTKQIIKKGIDKPDVILASSTHPLTCVAGIMIAKKYKIPCIVEIRDLWPLSIVEFSSKFTNDSLIIKLLYQGEKWIYTKADSIIFTMQGGRDYIIDQNWDVKVNLQKVYHINNGVDLKLFNKNKNDHQLMDEDLHNIDKFKVVYTGAIRRVNNIAAIIDVANKLREKNVDFLIWGDGNQLDELKNKAESLNVTNIKFKGRVPKESIPYILSKADLNLLHCQTADLYKYGISMNKSFDYIAAGVPILNTINTNYDLIHKHGLGLTVNSQQIDDIAQGILQLKEINKEELYRINSKAQEIAKEYDFEELTLKLIDVIDETIRSRETK